MPPSSLAVAQSLLLYGGTPAKPAALADLLDNAYTTKGGFRNGAETTGGIKSRPHHHFFHSPDDGHLSFGPGAGLAVGVSVGTETLRAGLVDANGWLHHTKEFEPDPAQLQRSPTELITRVRGAVHAVLRDAIADESLFSSMRRVLPLLGVAVAWPSPLSRNRRPLGFALSHQLWRNEWLLDRLLTESLAIEGLSHESRRSFALNDAHAAAIAVAHQMTHEAGYLKWRSPQLTLVLRLGGGIGGAIIVIEPPTRQEKRERRQAQITSGFPRSILIAGAENHAGEIGHVPVGRSVIANLNRGLPKGLGKMTPVHCTCVPATTDAPHHLEAYASATALTARLDPNRPMHEVIDDVRRTPDSPRHARALKDIGGLIAHVLPTPTIVLNAANVVLTGSLALEAMRTPIEEKLKTNGGFDDKPRLHILGDGGHEYIQAQGAALALIRWHVHRCLPSLLGGPADRTAQQIRRLTIPLDEAQVAKLAPRGRRSR